MQISENNEINFVFKINKITHLLNHIDVYYQKEILQDIKKYNNKINSILDNQNYENEESKKKVLYNHLNKYLLLIITKNEYCLSLQQRNMQKKSIDSYSRRISILL